MFSECFHFGPSGGWDRASFKADSGLSNGWDRASFKADTNDHRLGDLYGISPEAVLA